MMMRIAQLLQRMYKRRRDQHAMHGEPCSLVAYPFIYVAARRRWGQLGTYITRACCVPGWTRGDEAVALAETSYALPADAVLVEIGSFLGLSAVLLAGARKLRGSGIVHCVDPFDASGDTFSAPIYGMIAKRERRSLRERFEYNIRRAGLSKWVVAHQGLADKIAATWTQPIDFLFLDGDQSYQGVRTAYDSWIPFLRSDGVLAVHNSSRDHPYQVDHDGHMRLVAEFVRAPCYHDMQCIGTTTFARKA